MTDERIMIDAATQVFAVFGNPVSHSLSPVMFNRAFSKTGYNGVYVAFQVTAIGEGIAAMRSLGIKGASITIPHKVSILDFLDELDPVAESIGAVNTVINHKGRLKGYNSDCLGAVSALEAITCLEGKTCCHHRRGRGCARHRFWRQIPRRQTDPYQPDRFKRRKTGSSAGCGFYPHFRALTPFPLTF